MRKGQDKMPMDKGLHSGLRLIAGGLPLVVTLALMPFAQAKETGSLMAVDALGRPMPAAGEVAPRENRLVGMFYFLCNGEHGRGGPYDVSKILAADPAAAHEPDNPLWGPVNATHHWGEPLYGYYFSRDEWVVRRHIRLLTQAGIDFIFFDVANTFIYEKNAKLVMRVIQEYRDAGWNAPQVVFYTNPNPEWSAGTVKKLYEKIYAPRWCPGSWFMFEGKPLIIGREAACPEECRGFFTWRETQWPIEPILTNAWPWIDFQRPQHVFVNKRGEPEAISVSVAQHPQLRMGDSAMYGEKGNRGRAWHAGANDPAPDAWKKGLNFQEQFEYAIEKDVPVVMVTGWNEWTMGRGATPDRPGRPIQFVDCANGEYSRDIEMMRGGYGDNYFMQLCSLVRRYKGCADNPVQAAGDVAVYDNPSDGDFVRDCKGFGGTNYVNRTGRNAITRVTVSHDAQTVTFRIAAKNPIDPAKKNGTWFRIYVNTSGGQGYDYIVNNHAHGDGTASVSKVKRHDESLASKDILGATATWKIEDGALAVTCPRKALGIDGRDFEIWFKIADSKEKLRTVMDFYECGDAAPLGRLNHVYKGTDK